MPALLGLIERSKQGNWDWVGILRNSNSVPLQHAYDKLVLNSELQPPAAPVDNNKYILELRLLKLLSQSLSQIDSRILYYKFKALKPKERLMLLAQGILAIKQGRLTSVLKKSKRISHNKASVLLKAPMCSTSQTVFNELVETYSQWNASESDQYNMTSLNAKAESLALTIRHMTTQNNLPILRAFFKKIRLTPSSREIVLALLKKGNQSDLKLVLNRLAHNNEQIDYWNHTELGRAVEENMERLAKGIPSFLKNIISKREFSAYINPSERDKTKRSELLPLASLNNRALYIRIAAYSTIGAATKVDVDKLVELSNHQYGLIARSAAVKLTKLLGSDSLKLLSNNIEKAIQEGKSESCSEALRHAEMELFHL